MSKTKPINNQKKSKNNEVSQNRVVIVVQANKKPPFGFSELVALGMFIIAFITLLLKLLTYMQSTIIL